MHGQSSWSSQVGLDKWQIFKVMKQGIGTYRDLVLCLEFYSMDGGSRIQFHATVLLFRFIPDDHFCPSHLQDFHAVSFGMCENWRLIYFPKKVFHSHPSTGFSFLFTRESPLNRHWVGWFPGFLTSETHGGILQKKSPSSGCGPSTAPGLGCSIDDFPSASGTRANPPNRDVGSSHFLNGKPWVFLIYVSLP